jgi:hypothetical protein
MTVARWATAASAGVLALIPGLRNGRAEQTDASGGDQSAVAVSPPKSTRSYIEYGVALAAEGVASPGSLCKSVPLIASLGGQSNNCILGSGAGIAVRAGWRSSDVMYLGGAYETSKQDPNQLYRLGILQQLRIEWRRYFPIGRESVPFLLLGAGVHGYGNEWNVDTWGPDGTLGGGLEVELGGPVLELSVAYRAMAFRGWIDSSELPHNSGVAHFLGFEVSLEAKDAL